MMTNAILTTSESKKIIAKALVKNPVVANALKNGIVVIHPSSTTAFVFEEITGMWPDGIWAFGVMCGKGLCRSTAATQMLKDKDPNVTPRKQWVFIKGELQGAIGLGDILKQMGPDDVFIKSANAMDVEGNLATLSSKPSEGGTTGKVLSAAKERHFHIVMPTGLDKLVPTSIAEIAEKLGPENPQPSMGLACGVFPVPGAEKFDERDAFRLLCGVDCTVGASGGIAGAEGALCVFFTGEDDKVINAFELVKSIKGVILPNVDLPSEV